ncbi:MAG: four helix bundle protein [Candidatus Sumerlaeia bacterium]|nr:four helix bundle protein [Candidatus Sumerlaeia bacterium]
MRKIYEYDVFKLSHQLVVEIYELTKTLPKPEFFGLVSQMRKSAYSIPMNLVEGSARRSYKEFAHFIDIAIGSCEEIRYQLLLCRDLKYLSEETHQRLDKAYEKVKMMLSKLMSKIARSG